MLTRLTCGARCTSRAVCLLPEILMSYASVPFYFGGTSLLIVVVVAMDFMAAAAGAHDVAPVRGAAEEGEPARLRPLARRSG